jgi:uncharacterized DUF497 family protein
LSHPGHADWLEIDEENEEHVTAHGISPAELMQVFDGDPLWARNKKGRAGLWLMIGRTRGGRAIVAAVVYDQHRQSVRPITARDCERHEVARWLD